MSTPYQSWNGRILEPELARWPDMEIVIHRQGVKYFFGEQGLPTNLSQWRTSLQKANGGVALGAAKRKMVGSFADSGGE
jgi:hypothetical protein